MCLGGLSRALRLQPCSSELLLAATLNLEIENPSWFSQLGTSMAVPGPSGPPPSVSLSEKWERLKPHIKRLYIDENRPLSEVIITMKREYNFDSKSVG
jgi:hypothetical protein